MGERGRAWEMHTFSARSAASLAGCSLALSSSTLRRSSSTCRLSSLFSLVSSTYLQRRGWFGLVRFGSVWIGSVRFGLVPFGLVWFGSVWFGSDRFGLDRFGLVRIGLVGSTYLMLETAFFLSSAFSRCRLEMTRSAGEMRGDEGR